MDVIQTIEGDICTVEERLAFQFLELYERLNRLEQDVNRLRQIEHRRTNLEFDSAMLMLAELGKEADPPAQVMTSEAVKMTAPSTNGSPVKS